MKHFVYFDKDFIDSYLSQIDGGLRTHLQEEISDIIEKGKSEVLNPERISTEGNLSLAGWAGMKITTAESYLQESNSLKQVEAAKELVNKIIHDDSYDSLASDLKSKNLLKEFSDDDNSQNGIYIHINDHVDILDLSHLTSVFDDDFKVLFEAAEKGTFEKKIEAMNRAQKREQNKAIKETEKEINETIDGIEFGVKIIKFMSKVLPSDTFIVYKDYLIPLSRKYFREDPSAVRFKYIEKVHIIGKITGNMKDLMKRDVDNSLGDILNSLDDVAVSMLDVILPNKNLKVLYPIVLYFE